MTRNDAQKQVLLVSRPIAPGVHDGTVELVRTLATQGAAAGARFRVLTPVGAPAPGPGVATLPAALPGPLAQTAWRPLSFLGLALAPRAIRHYFFTPTPRVVSMLGRLHRLRPGPTVQTLCSAPPAGVDLAPLVFADRVVALSTHTRDRLLADGVAPERVWHIPPAVTLPADWTTPEGSADEALRRRVRQRLGLPVETPLVLYLGDYDTAGAALAVADALPAVLARTDAHAVIACRPKGARHDEVQAEVARRLDAAGAPPDRVHRLGTIGWSRELAAGADVALFPATALPDKMDLPLALLESLAAGVPAVVSNVGPLADLADAGAAVGENPDDPAALAAQLERLLADAEARRRAGARGCRWCRDEGSPAALGARHRALYESLVAAPRPKRAKR